MLKVELDKETEITPQKGGTQAGERQASGPKGRLMSLLEEKRKERIDPDKGL